ncbi:hypothetical protein EV659_11510 [Rhodothalassium salexigens DSM 2132]|uniref:Glycosyl transferase family 1 n=1 Tax=Rhodothalassium salexigens DSM 2132 TaxID=1188247 RepID=A0A4R2P8J7_RHOSA|nr:glycosyltransferase family 4 protein [Rhodothalassium salexigens]MBB4212742.1 glycosyltransferase involved in cell wall biosynthesis [Rhodothalassium salexigens DSM 2132]TCP30155.1 hypothetical protein EV659_11510 [Rhodothalassium salexigens DSM 2132]
MSSVTPFLQQLIAGQTPASPENRYALTDGADTLAGAFTALGDQTSEQVEQLSAILAQGRRVRVPFLRALANSLLCLRGRDPADLRRAVEAALLADLTLAEEVGTLNALARLFFGSTNLPRDLVTQAVDRDHLRALFARVVRRIAGLYDAEFAPRAWPRARTGRVVVMTQQFIDPSHAPTRSALSFARTLADDFGKQVLILCTKEYFDAPAGCIVPLFRANVLGQISGRTTVSFEGRAYDFFQPPGNRFDAGAVRACLGQLFDYQPEMILSLGGRNLVAEVLAEHTYLMMYPTTGGLPLTDVHDFSLWDEPGDDQRARMVREGIDTRFLFAQHPGFDLLPRAEGALRADYGLPEEAFVFAVVGMRLHFEIDDAFVAMARRLFEHPRARIAFAGHFNTYEALCAAHPEFAARSHFVGFQRDIMRFFSVCDGYINPDRAGGGSAIVYAMAAGLPALSLARGDAGVAVKNLPPLADYDAMAAAGRSLVDDAEVRETYRRLGAEAAEAYGSRRPFVARILDAFEADCARLGLAGPDRSGGVA